jgi:hypothetical protein
MILTKYRMIIGEGFTETLSLEEAQLSGYQYETIEEEIIEENAIS